MKLKLWEKEIPYIYTDAETPNLLHTYLLKTDVPLPCVVVYPGGGYAGRAAHEGAPIAEFFNSRGLQAVVVDYRVAPNRHPAPIADAQRAIRLVRAHASEWGIDPDRVVVCGFSAGGHLAASTLVWEDALPAGWERDAADAYSCRPNGGILCYPVISVESDFGHVNSGKRLLGEEAYEVEKHRFALYQYITEETPPAFLWHTSEDEAVNVKNSLIFCEKLRDSRVPFELHIYPHGRHGLGLAEDKPDICHWADQAADWILMNITGKKEN